MRVGRVWLRTVRRIVVLYLLSVGTRLQMDEKSRCHCGRVAHAQRVCAMRTLKVVCYVHVRGRRRPGDDVGWGGVRWDCGEVVGARRRGSVLCVAGEHKSKARQRRSDLARARRGLVFRAN